MKVELELDKLNLEVLIDYFDDKIDSCESTCQHLRVRKSDPLALEMAEYIEAEVEKMRIILNQLKKYDTY